MVESNGERAVAADQRFRTLAEAMPHIVWTTRADGYCEDFNRHWCEFTGMTLEASFGWGWLNATHPDDRVRTETRWQQAIESGNRYEIEYRLRRFDGSYRWFLGLAMPQRDDDRQIVRWIGTCTDIDANKQLEEQLRRSSERFRLLTETIPQLIWTADPAGNSTYFNFRWKEYTGLNPDQAKREGWQQIVHPDDADALRSSWQSAVQSRAASFEHEFRLRRSDGEYLWHLASAVPLHNREGEVVEWVSALTNIDAQKREAETLEKTVEERTATLRSTVSALQREVEERQRAEVKEKELLAELRRSNQELEQFACIASHDLREPLRKIQTFGDRLRTGYQEQLGEQGSDYIYRMEKSTKRLQQLIDDLLTFSRVASHAQPFAPVDLDSVVRNVLADIEDRVALTGGHVEVGNLPTVDADASQMHQLFQNLILNALKFHKPDVPPQVKIKAEIFGALPDESFCRIVVEDNGIGFDERYLDRIFQMFQRLHGRDRFEGTGIGLAICRKIVDRHGGTITARSQPGNGATFVVVLPMRLPIEPNRLEDDSVGPSCQ